MPSNLIFLFRGADDELHEPPRQTQEHEIQPILIINAPLQAVNSCISSDSLQSPSKIQVPDIVLLEAEKIPKAILATGLPQTITDAPPAYSDVVKSICI
ncbi:unnamed protein product [Enterobius vermicularis]|uniref:Uncharacterized protein n=1 Tax=Enterobius vermicularis TaxID=51028 RepID=A0A0N4VKK7_ENTVE|nr:unnamed protein product [Enterobius vermicularis]